MEFYTDIDEVPSLNDFDDDNKNKEKLIIFDDFINLTKKQMVKINQYLTAGRKFSFTVFLLAQNYVSVSKTITRNINYFIIFNLILWLFKIFLLFIIISNLILLIILFQYQVNK